MSFQIVPPADALLAPFLRGGLSEDAAQQAIRILDEEFRGFVDAANELQTRVEALETAISALTSVNPYDGVVVYRTNNFTLVDGTPTKILWDSETMDNPGGAAFHDFITNPSRLTIPTGLGGAYLIEAVVLLQQNIAGFRRLQIFKNGNPWCAAQDLVANTNGYTSLRINQMMGLSPGEYIELEVYQNSGSSLTVSGTAGGVLYTWMSLTRIGV